MNLKIKIVCVFAIIPLVISFLTISRLVKKTTNLSFPHNKVENQINWSEENLSKADQRILKDQKITQEFTSQHNNLGTIAVQFTNFQKINDDFVTFKIYEKDKNGPIYENKYKVDQFHPIYPFTFGFPPIVDSKNKTFIFEIQSINGTKNNSIGISNQKDFSAKYDFSLKTLKENPSSIFELIKINLNTISQLKKGPLYTILLVYFLIALFIVFENKIIKFIPKKFIGFIPKTHPYIIFALTAIISGYFSTFGADPHHDGIMIKPALDLANGSMLFKDTFTQYGPLSTIIQALSLKIFGEYLIVIKLVTVFFYSTISVVIYHVWSKFLSKNFAFFSCLIWLFLAPYYTLTFLPWSSVYALLFQCLTIIFFQRYIKNNNSTNIILAGIASGLTFLCKQNVGVYTILGSLTVIFLIKITQKQKNKKLINNLVRYITGGILVSLPILIWITGNNAFSDFWKQTFIFPTHWVSSTKPFSLFESFFPHAIGPISVWAIAPIIALILLFKQLIAKQKNTYILVVSIFSLFSWMQYYPVTCIRHIYWAATPMIGLIIYFIKNQIFPETIVDKHKYLTTFVFLITCTIIFGPDIYSRIQSGLKKINTKYETVNTPKILKKIKLPPQEAEFYLNTYKEIEKYQNKKPDTNLITFSPNALYLTFGRSANFHPIYVNWASINESIYPDYPQIIDKYIMNNKPLIVSMWDQLPSGYCRTNNNINPIDTAFLIIPCEQK